MKGCLNLNAFLIHAFEQNKKIFSIFVQTPVNIFLTKIFIFHGLHFYEDHKGFNFTHYNTYNMIIFKC